MKLFLHGDAVGSGMSIEYMTTALENVNGAGDEAGSRFGFGTGFVGGGGVGLRTSI